MIKINFFRGSGFVQTMIRWFTHADYAHVSITVNDVEYEASLFDGVRIVKKPKKPDAVYAIETGNIKKIEHFLKTQKGKDYDLLAIFAFLFSAKWNKKNEWFCSELAAKALKISGVKNINMASVIDPGDLFEILKKSGIGTFTFY